MPGRAGSPPAPAPPAPPSPALAAVPAGAVAERFNFNAYLGYSMFIGGWVYPIIAHVSGFVPFRL